MSTDVMDIEALETLLNFIKQDRGFDFTGYKRPSLERRIHRRMREVKADTYQEYLDYLQAQPGEFTQLFNTILINVTRFFRDPESWQFLATHVLPSILEKLPSDEPIRIWNPGCASGQDVCSIAILLAEALGRDAFRKRVKIYGTDVDEHALAEARLATYSAAEFESMPEEYRAVYFEQHEDRYVFSRDLRKCIVFGRHDLVQDAPISRTDLIICRNTLMYFNAETQTKILSNFHYALKHDAALFLGKGEMLLTHFRLFAPIELKHRIFRPISDPDTRKRARIVTTGDESRYEQQADPGLSLQDLAYESSPIAQFVLDADNRLVIANSEARSQFGIRAEDLGTPLQDFQISYHPTDLRSKIDEVRKTRRQILHEDVRWTLSPGNLRYLSIEITPLFGPESDLSGVSVTIVDTSQKQGLQTELERSRQDLETAHEELESTIEEVETTNEELQSTNEELETMNEELQSTNEELETMNEELQSTNEELETINTELRIRTAELDHVNTFLESILTSLRVGVVVVDADLHIQIWNGRSADLWGLRSGEVIGGHLLNLDIGLPVERLRGPIRECLNGDSEAEVIVVRATNRTGKQIDCKVTCMPLVAHDSGVCGAIMLMEALAPSHD